MLAEPKLKIKWALICSVPAEEDMKQLSDFGEWFVGRLTTVGREIGVDYSYEQTASCTEKIAPGDLDGCIIAYEKIHKDYPSVHVVIHVLPFPASDEYAWMKSLSNQYGMIRQGVLLENAKQRFANVEGAGAEVFKNVSQWISRSAHKLSTSKNPAEKLYDLRVGVDSAPVVSRQFVPHVIHSVVNNVLHGIEPNVCRDESAVQVEGFPARLNEYGVAQLFPGLTITGVTLKGPKAMVVFANKFQAYQACELNKKIHDQRYKLHVVPLCGEVLSQLAVNDLSLSDLPQSD